MRTKHLKRPRTSTHQTQTLYTAVHGHTCEYVRALIASGKIPKVLLTHVTTVGADVLFKEG